MTDRDALRLKLSGYLAPGEEIHRHVLFDQLCAAVPTTPELKVMVFTAEIAPGGYTNWHKHNGATFFLVLQGEFEAEFQEGVLVRAKAGDVYSEPVGKVHRGHNPNREVPFICVALCLTPPDLEHVTSVPERPW
jgi:quercetin dioxygenase-like cupin family protein